MKGKRKEKRSDKSVTEAYYLSRIFPLQVKKLLQ